MKRLLVLLLLLLSSVAMALEPIRFNDEAEEGNIFMSRSRRAKDDTWANSFDAGTSNELEVRVSSTASQALWITTDDSARQMTNAAAESAGGITASAIATASSVRPCAASAKARAR